MSETSLLTFPCRFPIKVMALNLDGLELEILLITQQHVPDFQADQMQLKHSRTAKYLSLSLDVYVKSQQQLDDLYRALTAHEHVKMVL